MDEPDDHPVRQRFDGEICGVGTAAGVRFVVGNWSSSPFGAFADVMVEAPGGGRTLLAPDQRVADLVTSIYAFDDVIVGEVAVARTDGELRVDAGPLQATMTIGRRDALGLVLRAVPRRVATSTRWTAVTDPVARLLLRGVRTRGRTAGGVEHYAATDRHRVTAVHATWDDVDLGALRPVVPAVRFGFSSTPATPSIVRVTTTVIPTAGGAAPPGGQPANASSPASEALRGPDDGEPRSVL